MALRSPRGALAAGSPEEVAEKILFEHELFGHQRYLAQMAAGEVEHGAVMRSIERFGTEVAPLVRIASWTRRACGVSDARRAARRAHARAGRHPLRVARRGAPGRPRRRPCLGADATSATPACSSGRGAPVLLAGHLDTVPGAGQPCPGRIDGERVHGLGASDMKGALAVMIELALAGAPFDCLFFGREELPGDVQRAGAAARARAARRTSSW